MKNMRGLAAEVDGVIMITIKIKIMNKGIGIDAGGWQSHTGENLKSTMNPEN